MNREQKIAELNNKIAELDVNARTLELGSQEYEKYVNERKRLVDELEKLKAGEDPPKGPMTGQTYSQYYTSTFGTPPGQPLLPPSGSPGRNLQPVPEPGQPWVNGGYLPHGGGASGYQVGRYDKDGNPQPWLQQPQGNYSQQAWNQKSKMSETERLSRLTDRLNNRLYYNTATADSDASHYRMEPMETEDTRQQKDNRDLKNLTNRRARENTATSEQMQITNIALTDQLARTLWSKAQENDEEARALFNRLMVENLSFDEKMNIGLKYLGPQAMARLYESYGMMSQQLYQRWNEMHYDLYKNQKVLEHQLGSMADITEYIKSAEEYMNKIGIPQKVAQAAIDAFNNLNVAEAEQYRQQLNAAMINGQLKTNATQFFVDVQRDFTGRTPLGTRIEALNKGD
jgi:hypothetical protein